MRRCSVRRCSETLSPRRSQKFATVPAQISLIRATNFLISRLHRTTKATVRSAKALYLLLQYWRRRNCPRIDQMLRWQVERVLAVLSCFGRCVLAPKVVARLSALEVASSKQLPRPRCIRRAQCRADEGLRVVRLDCPPDTQHHGLIWTAMAGGCVTRFAK